MKQLQEALQAAYTLSRKAYGLKMQSSVILSDRISLCVQQGIIDLDSLLDAPANIILLEISMMMASIDENTGKVHHQSPYIIYRVH